MKYKEHLKKQLGFLERSCDSYDKGHKDEAVRIATVIRVLVHDTNNSTSLLEHLDSKSINLLSTTPEPSPDTIHYIGMGMISVSGSEGNYEPTLGNGPPVNEYLQVRCWWEQVVYVLDRHRITRKKIVLTAANKDGGAHIDKKLTKEYDTLANEGVVGKLIYHVNGNYIEHSFDDAHYVSLRQMAYEILNSPELKKLVENG